MKLLLKQYAKVLDQALAGSKSDAESKQIVGEFIESVTKDAKLSKVNEILAHFGNLWDKRHNVLNAEVQTVDGEEINLPKEIKGKKLVVTTKANPSLLGGSIIKIGDYIIDSSVSSKINALRK
ncbi:MAG: putative synthase oligomycin sensitivity conferral protein [Candidatus Taylorbacteria bacterium]|nr:putative synthase oligomycin sensitivity conferral protein [Candidatus Taylorbacteria bacterium]